MSRVLLGQSLALVSAGTAPYNPFHRHTWLLPKGRSGLAPAAPVGSMSQILTALTLHSLPLLSSLKCTDGHFLLGWYHPMD